MGEKSTKIKFTYLDEFIVLNKISNVDFIKLDVDGFEYNVLSGGMNFLKEKKPHFYGIGPLSL